MFREPVFDHCTHPRPENRLCDEGGDCSVLGQRREFAGHRAEEPELPGFLGEESVFQLGL